VQNPPQRHPFDQFAHSLMAKMSENVILDQVIMTHIRRKILSGILVHERDRGFFLRMRSFSMQV
jgi:hypothetical protein